MGQQRVSILDWSTVATTAVAPYRGVGFTGAQIAAAGAKILGISKHAAVIGEPLELAIIGSMTVESGAAFAVGAALTMDATGRVVTAGALTATASALTASVTAGAVAVTSTAANGAIVTGTAAAQVLSGGDLPVFIVGHALEAATAAGQFCEVLLCR